MDQEITVTKAASTSLSPTRLFKRGFLVLVWVPFLGSNYLTISHLIAWLRTDRWPAYSTGSLVADLRIAHPDVVRAGAQSMKDWMLTLPAAYSLMAVAIVLSIAMTMLPDD